MTDVLARTPNSRTKLSISGLNKAYGAIVALRSLDLEVRAGELMTLLGASGSGKTTLLQVVSGLLSPTSGRIVIDGVDHTHTPAHRRDIGVVFQNYALFPHLTIEENIGFPLSMRKLPRPELRRKVQAALDMVELGAMSTRFPRELSGGQQQRVALARCFVYEPSLILMDEPLSALDRKLRETMQSEIRRLHRETGSTIVFVTHDQEEALALSDRICLMHNARIEQIGTPEQIYNHPATRVVADLIGISNVLAGTVTPGHRLQTVEGSIPLSSDLPLMAGAKGAVTVRPEYLSVVAAGAGRLQGQLIDSVYAGSETRWLVRLPQGTEITVRRGNAMDALVLGQQVGIDWPAERSHFLIE